MNHLEVGKPEDFGRCNSASASAAASPMTETLRDDRGRFASRCNADLFQLIHTFDLSLIAGTDGVREACSRIILSNRMCMLQRAAANTAHHPKETLELRLRLS